MKIKFASAAAAVAMAFAAQVAHAEETPEITLTGSAAVVSQYRFRGISQSDQKPAVQMSVTATHKSGFYVSVWGSSASAGQSAVNIGGTEIDVYGGYSKAFAGITFDGGVYGYIYPGAPAGNYYELYGSVSKTIGPVSAKAGLYWAPKQDYFTTFGTATKFSVYKYADLSFAVPETPLTFTAHIGHTAGGFAWTKPYMDYSVGVAYKIKAITVGAQLVGTNVSKADAGGTNEMYRATKTAAVLSLTASF
ncbi:hypothetical protein GTZ99_12195 [Novosphingobium sp. FSY-8]|uniref:Uncharacterized protein n=1 Tax=Novosphingobium ovatum TaxID=1908523 RepID=A0ABW9XFN1_9SPHN|nr:TorF family putative porin [Novosphingobium ovatum]NBC37316.1 hypothetical protein [Novosphingobium ovatum]